jgi:hypothetical protein
MTRLHAFGLGIVAALLLAAFVTRTVEPSERSLVLNVLAAFVGGLLAAWGTGYALGLAKGYANAKRRYAP